MFLFVAMMLTHFVHVYLVFLCYLVFYQYMVNITIWCYIFGHIFQPELFLVLHICQQILVSFLEFYKHEMYCNFWPNASPRVFGNGPYH